MKDTVAAYIKRVRELAEHCHGNEQATKQSLIGPLFTLLGYDLTDPRECKPEYKADFGKERSSKPVDWAFLKEGRLVFFVEAKEVSRGLKGFDEQLADYFAKAPDVKLGILTNGVHWRFFTDLVNANVMDQQPFVTWDVLNDEHPPLEFLKVLQKAQYSPDLVRTFAQRRWHQNLLVAELSRLLEPSAEFTKLAIYNIETRNITSTVIDQWKPIVANAIDEWAKQRRLSTVLDAPNVSAGVDQHSGTAAHAAAAPETTQEELAAFAAVRGLLGVERPIAYQDTASYFKIHLPERHTWVIARLYLGRKRPLLWVPLPAEVAAPLAGGRAVSTPEAGWTAVALETAADIEQLGELVRSAWDAKRRERPSG